MSSESVSFPKKIFHYGLLWTLVLAAVFPFLWLLSTALKGPQENIFAYPPQLIPQFPSLQAFMEVWQKVPLLQYVANSLAVAMLTVGLNVGFSTLAAYPLARIPFKGQPLIFYSILLTMMMPFQVLMIPLYLLTLQLGLTDANGLFPSWLGLSLPFAMSGFGVYFMRQSFLGIPRELEEAAVMDGANSFQTLRHVLLPHLSAALGTLAVFTFLTSWGEFLWPSILINQTHALTLPVGLVQLQGVFSSNWRLIAAGAILSMVPVLILFCFTQRWLMGNTLEGSVKG